MLENQHSKPPVSALIDKFLQSVDVESEEKVKLSQFTQLKNTNIENILYLDTEKISETISIFDQLLEQIEDVIFNSNVIVAQICCLKLEKWVLELEDAKYDSNFEIYEFIEKQILTIINNKNKV